MYSVVGIFASRAVADQTMQELLQNNISAEQIKFLTPGTPEVELEAVPTTDAEADGMGKGLGAFVGGVVGASAGLGLGSAIASLVLPGVGPVFAVGLGAAALLGLGGGVAGEAAGDIAEHAMDEGVPKDEVLFYRDLLRRGHSIVIVDTTSAEDAARSQEILQRNGAEDLDAARQEWHRAA